VQEGAMSEATGELVVRWATRWDREAVCKLVGALARQHGVEATPEDLREAFEFALRTPDEYRFCVVARDREVLAVAALHRAYSSWHGRPYGTIEDVYVSEEARRGGLASRLLEFIRQEAERRGYCRLSLDVLDGNQAAQSCYQRFGMADAGYRVYEMELGEDG
jgi:ribosomal protein S18 acetylase RimI-like enzyme